MAIFGLSGAWREMVVMAEMRLYTEYRGKVYVFTFDSTYMCEKCSFKYCMSRPIHPVGRICPAQSKGLHGYWSEL